MVCNLLDWLTWRLTGTLTQSAGDSGYKRMLQDGTYPSHEYLEAVKPGFGTVFEDKMSAPVLPLGAKVGGLTKEMAELTGLPEGIAVASGNIDAHVVVAGRTPSARASSPRSWHVLLLRAQRRGIP